MIRQVIKYCYAVDINNLPINESTTDQKRKIKKKNVYALGTNSANSSSTSANSTTATGSTASAAMSNGALHSGIQTRGVAIGLNNSSNTPNNPISVKQIAANNSSAMSASMTMTKPRSRTEVYHPSSVGHSTGLGDRLINANTLSAAAAAAAAAVASSTTSNTTVPSNSNFSVTNSSVSSRNGQTPVSIPNVDHHNHHQSEKSGSSSAQQSNMLNRQRKFSVFRLVFYSLSSRIESD